MRWAAPCFPAGVGQTEQQVQAIGDLQPDALRRARPSFLKHPDREGRRDRQSTLPVAAQGAAGGEALAAQPARLVRRARHRRLPELRHRRPGPHRLRNRGARRLVLDEGVIVEIVRPGTGDPVPEGEVGEVVVTTLNPDYPLIRFGTGDLSAVLPGRARPAAPTPASRAGWAAPTRPPRSAACSCIRRRWRTSRGASPRCVKARLVVSGEMANDAHDAARSRSARAPQGLDARIGEAIRDVTKLRGDVQLLRAGSLPNDGKVIEDARSTSSSGRCPHPNPPPRGRELIQCSSQCQQRNVVVDHDVVDRAFELLAHDVDQPRGRAGVPASAWRSRSLPIGPLLPIASVTPSVKPSKLSPG